MISILFLKDKIMENKIRTKNFVKILGVVLFLSLFCTSGLMAKEKNTEREKPTGIVDKLIQVSQKEKLKGLKEKAEDAKNDAQAAKTVAEFKQKEIMLEIELAKEKLDEAKKEKQAIEIEKKEATGKELRNITKIAKLKQKEISAVETKIKLLEKKLLQAKNKTEQSIDQWELTKSKLAIIDTEIKRRLYKKLLHTVMIVLIGYVAMFVLVRIVNRKIDDLKMKHLTRRNVVYIVNILIIISIVFLWVKNISSITIFLSLITAGMVLVMQEPILAIAGWVYILVRKPFEVGDRVEIGQVKGDVIDIRMLQTSLLEIGNWIGADQSTGRIVNVPNSAIFKKESFNYSHGFEFIWNEIEIMVTFESDWKQAEKIMINHGQQQADGMAELVKNKITKMTSRYMIYYDKLSPIVYVDIKESGVRLTLRYLTDARKRRTTHDALCRMILNDFATESKINFAYTTYRIVK